MGPGKTDATRHVIETDAFADIGFHQCQGLADAEVAAATDHLGGRILRPGCIGGIYDMIDEAFEFVSGELVIAVAKTIGQQLCRLDQPSFEFHHGFGECLGASAQAAAGCKPIPICRPQFA